MPEGEERPEALRDIFPTRMVARVVGNESAVRVLGGEPRVGGRMKRIERGVRRLVHQDLLQHAVAQVLRGLAGMDQYVVVAAAEGHDAPVNPNGLDPCSQARRQLPDGPGVEGRVALGQVGIAELHVDLHLDDRIALEGGVEQVGIGRHEGVGATIEHPAHVAARGLETPQRRRVGRDDEVGVDEGGPAEGRLLRRRDRPCASEAEQQNGGKIGSPSQAKHGGRHANRLRRCELPAPAG